jgi:hypothetical protein
VNDTPSSSTLTDTPPKPKRRCWRWRWLAVVALLCAALPLVMLPFLRPTNSDRILIDEFCTRARGNGARAGISFVAEGWLSRIPVLSSWPAISRLTVRQYAQVTLLDTETAERIVPLLRDAPPVVHVFYQPEIVDPKVIDTISREFPLCKLFRLKALPKK